MARRIKIKGDEFMKKLSLWDVRTFKPILTHDELEPILEKAGFIPLQKPPVPPAGVTAWREYSFRAIKIPPCNDPKVRLPYPELDGLHIFTFSGFLEAMAFYLGADEVHSLFDIRSLPLDRTRDHRRSFRVMRDCGIDEDWMYYVYREGTLSPPTQPVCSFNTDGYGRSIDNICYMRLNVALKGKYKQMDCGSINLVPQTDLFPQIETITC